MQKRLLVLLISFLSCVILVSSLPTQVFAGPFKVPGNQNSCFRPYGETWLVAPIKTDGAFQCYDFCSKSIVDSANKAYDDKETAKETRKRIDKYIDGSDESKGQGGHTYKTLSECREKQGITAPPNSPDASCPTSGNITISPCRITIDTAFVSVYFENVPLREGDSSQSQYYYCLKTDPKDCDDDDLKSITDNDAKSKGILVEPGTAPKTERVTFTRLCGDGSSKLKTRCDDDGSDWFHQGKTYRVTLFDKNKVKSNIITDASFYVTHAYPTIIEPTPGPRPDLNIDKLTATGANGKIKVTLERKNSLKKDVKVKYWLQLQGRDTDYNSPEACLEVPPNSSASTDVLLPKEILVDGVTSQVLTEGNYVLSIKETRDGCKQGNFTYAQVPVLIAVGYIDGKPEKGLNPGKIGNPIEDPFGQEGGRTNIKRNPPAICAPNQKDGNGNCTSIRTGLGISIHTEPKVFVRDVFRIVLFIGGIAAFVFFIRAGYTIMTSAGNKEKVGQAREQITAAITGLIFIILSITILEFIGINILQIPGLSR